MSGVCISCTCYYAVCGIGWAIGGYRNISIWVLESTFDKFSPSQVTTWDIKEWSVGLSLGGELWQPSLWIRLGYCHLPKHIQVILTQQTDLTPCRIRLIFVLWFILLVCFLWTCSQKSGYEAAMSQKDWKREKIYLFFLLNLTPGWKKKSSRKFCRVPPHVLSQILTLAKKFYVVVRNELRSWNSG